MTDNLFPFMYWALGNGLAANAWPGNGADLVTGGTPRYRLYDTKDGKVVAAAPIEQKFWDAFASAIGLDAALADDRRDQAATAARVTEIIASRPAAEWAPVFERADCCCSIVVDVRAALEDPHFRARGLFAHRLTNAGGAQLAALPVPVDGSFRSSPDDPAAAPSLGAHNSEFGL
jgi:crotonobetainyl-CoA:carnitine CoA-transferase CaiB-like acyl-CoA transferase